MENCSTGNNSKSKSNVFRNSNCPTRVEFCNIIRNGCFAKNGKHHLVLFLPAFFPPPTRERMPTERHPLHTPYHAPRHAHLTPYPAPRDAPQEVQLNVRYAHSSLTSCFEMSFASLPSQSAERLLDLAVYREDASVPLTALAVRWCSRRDFASESALDEVRRAMARWHMW